MAELKKINKSLKDSNDTCEVHVEDFIPYACHFNKNTILTKNGELLQVIKLTGFAFETVKADGKTALTIRGAVRKAIAESIKTTNFAVYLHTFRRKTNLATHGEYPPGFTKDLNDSWCRQNQWDGKHTNELYLTVMIEGQSLNVVNIKTLIRCLHFKKELEFRDKYLDNAHEDLTKTVDNILKQLEPYGAKKLQINKQDDGIYYSEITSFFGKIINLKEEQIPLAAVNIAEVLPSHKLSFGFNTLISAGDTGKHYGAILTIKSYHEVSSKYIDDFLQVSQQFIVTESFDFVNHKKALETFKKQVYFHKLSKDNRLSKASGLDDILAANTGSPLDYGEHQITVLIVEDSPILLKEGVAEVYNALSGLGIISIREDIFMEDCYWAQLPGNFEFNKRMSPINTDHIGGFASLYSYPAGRKSNNLWGSAITVFYTANNTPYFFNFHYGDNGHTFIVGPYGSGKTVLLNFLVGQAIKYNTKLFFFDYKRGGEIFIRAINGSYQRISDNPHYGKGKFNPLLLPDSKESKKFLKNWFSYLLGAAFKKLEKDDQEKIDAAISHIYNKLLPQDRTLGNVIPLFWPIDDKKKTIKDFEDEIINKIKAQAKEDGNLSSLEINNKEVRRQIPHEYLLTQWYGEGEYAYLFDNLIDSIDYNSGHTFGYDLTEIIAADTPLVPTIYYIMHKIEESLDGSPTIIVLDEAWKLIDNYAFSENIKNWMIKLRRKNTIVIFATESIDGAEKSPMTKILANEIETKIFLPNKKSTPAGYEQVFGLNAKEYELLASMNSNDREFLLIHNIDAVVAKLDLSYMEDELNVLSSTPETLRMMEISIVQAGPNAEDWLPIFKERLKY